MVQPLNQMRGLFAALIEDLLAAGSEVMIIGPDQQKLDFSQKRFAGNPKVQFLLNNVRYAAVRERTSQDADLLRQARTYEQRLGRTINQFAIRDRHLGRGYAPGGFLHPRSRMSEEARYIDVVAAFVAELDLFAEAFERWKPTILINGGEIAGCFAEERGIPIRRLVGSRTENYWQWADSERFENSRIRKAYDAVDRDLEPYVLSAPYRANEKFVTAFEGSITVPALTKKSARLAANFASWRLRGFEKGRGYYFRELLASVWRPRRAWREMTGPRTTTLTELADRPFVFFPLQTEPEVALQGLSPEFLFQLEAIIRLSKDLPAGVWLGVKDTPVALGRRPAGFYRQIQELKNVVLLDIRSRGVDVVNAATAVATICGTAGFEAAIIGKPVIVFGEHNPYDFLPHVFRVGRDGTLQEGLRSLLSSSFNAAKAQRDGRRYLEAVRAVSFRLEDSEPSNPERTSAADMMRARQSLVETLDSEHLVDAQL
jgi:hypothetical protein